MPNNLLMRKDYPRKVELLFDQIGSPILKMTERTPDGDLFYYMQHDGSWTQYDPAVNKAAAFSNERFTAHIDPADWKIVSGSAQEKP